MDRQIKKPSRDDLKRIGIFGSNGFIGNHLRVEFASQKINYDVFEGDALNKGNIEEFFNNSDIKEVVFLIGSFNPPMKNLIEKNLLTLQAVLEFGVHQGLKKIIYVSSGAVYGKPDSEGSFETDSLLPISLYGLTKKYCEECVHYYEENYGIKGIILRFPNVYGDGNNKGVVNEFLNKIQNKQSIIIEGDGEQGRNFLHVSDAVLAIYKSLNIQSSEVINVANDRRITINELVKIMAHYRKFDVIYDNSKNLSHDKLYLNISKCKKILKFTPRFDIKTYMRQKLHQ